MGIAATGNWLFSKATLSITYILTLICDRFCTRSFRPARFQEHQLEDLYCLRVSLLRSSSSVLRLLSRGK